MRLPIHVEGHEGALLGFEKNIYTLRSPAAFAPGQPLHIHVLATPEPFELEARTIGVKRREDGDFLVRARAINLRREHREVLASASGEE